MPAVCAGLVPTHELPRWADVMTLDEVLEVRLAQPDHAAKRSFTDSAILPHEERGRSAGDQEPDVRGRVFAATTVAAGRAGCLGGGWRTDTGHGADFHLGGAAAHPLPLPALSPTSGLRQSPQRRIGRPHAGGRGPLVSLAVLGDVEACACPRTTSSATRRRATTPTTSSSRWAMDVVRSYANAAARAVDDTELRH